MGKTSLEQMYIEGLKEKCTTQETYTSEPDTIATTIGCLGLLEFLEDLHTSRVK